MKFNYFYGSESEQYSFIRIPRIMILGEMYRDLSTEAKFLYAVLLDRMSLSMKNNWYDEKRRAYIIYQIEEIKEDLGFTKKKAMDVLAELEEFGLLEKKRRGHGLPNILYVKNFIPQPEAEDPLEETIDLNEEAQAKQEAEVPETSTVILDGADDFSSGSRQMACVRFSQIDTSGKLIRLSRSSRTDTSDRPIRLSRSSETDTSDRSIQVSRSSDSELQEVPKLELQEVSDSGLQEVPESVSLKNQNNMNHTYGNYTESHRFLSAGDAMRREEGRFEATGDDKAEAYREVIRENISYAALVHDKPNEINHIDGIVDLMTEIMLCQQKEILIASSWYPAETVKNRFMKLDINAIKYVILCLEKNTTEIRNYKKYMLAALFNAPSTISGYYQSQVLHDNPQYAKK